MAEVIIKLDIPDKFELEFKAALKKVLDKFVHGVEFSLANEILSKSKLTEEQAKQLATEVKSAVAKRHGVT
ncbi:MAG: hypothetical protein AABX33_03160 [Nanoarchaeota archaeon]